MQPHDLGSQGRKAPVAQGYACDGSDHHSSHHDPILSFQNYRQQEWKMSKSIQPDRTEMIADKITRGIYSAPFSNATERQRGLAMSIAANISAALPEADQLMEALVQIKCVPSDFSLDQVRHIAADAILSAGSGM